MTQSKQVYIVSNPLSIDLLKKITHQNFLHKQYLWLHDRDENMIHLLEDNGFTRLEISPSNQESHDVFLRSYIDCIGSISTKDISWIWWATDIASKNRFASRLPLLLQEFVTIIKAIEPSTADVIVVIKPSWVLIPSLKKHLQEKNIRAVWFDDIVEKWKDISIQRINYFFSSFKDILTVGYWSIRMRGMFGSKFRELRKSKQSFYVLKTFIYDSSFSEDEKYTDSFFGKLPYYIKGEKPLIIFARILGNYKVCLKTLKVNSDFTIIPFEALLSLRDIVYGIMLLLFSKIKIYQPIAFNGYDVTDVIGNELFLTRNGIALPSLLHYWATKRLTQKCSIETFLMTYENNPWEKMCILALRKFAPHCTIIGYQHSVAHHSAANIFISQYERSSKFIPDSILTVGGRSKQIMERYGSYPQNKIRAACALRFEYLSHIKLSPRQKIHHILIALEGVIDVYRLVNYIFQELKDNTRYELRIRAHPVLPFEKIKSFLLYDTNMSPHIKISNATTVQEDLEWSDVVVYWGSTVAFEALKMGKPLICYNTPSLLNYDPLFECPYLKWIVQDGDNLIGTLDTIDLIHDEEFSLLQKKASEYISEYFYPVTETCFRTFL